jgi:ribonuclease Z
VLAVLSFSGRPEAQGAPFEVTLLGTGSPRPVLDRFGPATLVRVGSQRLLFDAGRGVTVRLTQAGINLRDVDAVFLTHFHSDHVNGLVDLWLTGWLPAPYGQRTGAFRVFGPTGTRDMMGYLERAHAADIRIRIADERLSPAGVAIDALDVTEGVAYARDGVRVTAFDVDHGEQIKPALGYRVEFEGRSVVLSGDTRYSANLVKHAQGADVLVHEVIAIPPGFQPATASGRGVLEHHTTPEQAARVFTETRPRLAVYSHVITQAVTPEEVIRRTRAVYAGAVVVGADLMTIDVRSATVRRADAPAQ